MITQEEISLDREMAIALESTEAAYWSKYYSPDQDLICFASVIAGSFVGSIPEVDVLAMNRVIGLGMQTVVDPQDIQSIIKFYMKAGSRRFIVQVSDFTIQDNLQEILLDAGFKHHNRWAKLKKELNPHAAPASSELQIRKIHKYDYEKEVFGQIIYECFDWEEPRLKKWLAKTVGQSGYSHYLAYNEEKPVAAAALHITGKYASLALAGTLPKARGMGAQNSLIAVRLKEAEEKGCQYIFSETGVHTVEKPVQSYKNMIKMGFEEVYQRDNWLFEF